ncbi:possible thiamine kinase [Weissella oryzae SG25]|uniref:Thiamine diphosphokinase n=1 Tax=Weissella oryzae (strain DSM 25784 / JCM 18191 / LMG 30913 / SG25) TaxID=1329250 RepID=A0A069CS69_WEIOS|nr:thiamine diphosphokinase [Weissella oryzae]GAK30665.1 possible thiamine kinase [Weissella oryzae SG25]
MKKMHVLIGGPVSEWPDELATGQIAGPWVAADRGALRLLKLGIVPELVVGDFDSMSATEKALVDAQVARRVAVRPEKDETDTELLLSLLNEDKSIDEIIIYGATGGRLDQLLSNLWIFTQERFLDLVPKVQIVDRVNVLKLFLPGQHTIKRLDSMHYLGFMNLTPVKNLTLLDEKYRLQEWSSTVPFSWSSNEFSGTVNHFSFDAGIVAVIQSRDLHGQQGD